MLVLTTDGCYKEYCELSATDKIVTTQGCALAGDSDAVSGLFGVGEEGCKVSLEDAAASCCVPGTFKYYSGTEFEEQTVSFLNENAVRTSDTTGYIIGNRSDGGTIRADLVLTPYGDSHHEVIPILEVFASTAWPEPYASSPLSVINTEIDPPPPPFDTSLLTWTFSQPINGALEMTAWDIDDGDVLENWNITPDSIGPTGDLVDTKVRWDSFTGNTLSFEWTNAEHAASNYSFLGDLQISVPALKNGTTCVYPDGTTLYYDADGNELTDPDVV